MTTKHEAALRAQAAEYAERMMRREWRVVPQAGIEPGDGRGNWYIEAIDTRFGMHSLVMWAYQSKSAYDRAFLERVCDEHNATIRDTLTAQGERLAGAAKLLVCGACDERPDSPTWRWAYGDSYRNGHIVGGPVPDLCGPVVFDHADPAPSAPIVHSADTEVR